MRNVMCEHMSVRHVHSLLFALSPGDINHSRLLLQSARCSCLIHTHSAAGLGRRGKSDAGQAGGLGRASQRTQVGSQGKKVSG
jgi:hypothetical protein